MPISAPSHAIQPASAITSTARAAPPMRQPIDAALPAQKR